MQPYTSRTGSGRTLEALEAHGWGLLVNAYGVHRHEGFRYGIDNGAAAKSADGVKQRPQWSEGPFVELVERLGRGADFIVAPDIVAGGLESLRRSERWLPWVAEYALPLVAVQDGMETADVWPLVGPRCGLFVGGSTDWKWSTLHLWADLAKRRGCYLHVGRVNGYERISTCKVFGADSFDGTAALFAVNIPRLTNAVRQEVLEAVS